MGFKWSGGGGEEEKRKRDGSSSCLNKEIGVKKTRFM
jgi:hypothetical protein